MSHQNGGASSVSFKITNPTGSTSSRPQASTSSGHQHRNSHRHHYSHQRYASDSESDGDEFGHAGRRKARDESISGIDSKGIRSSSAAKKDKPLVIPTAPNKDFRRAALELRAQKEGRQRFIPGQVSSMQGGEAKERVLTEAERKFLESDSNVQRIGDKTAVGGIKQRGAAPSSDTASNDVDMSRDKTPVPGTNGFSKMLEEEAASGMAVDADALALRELLKEHDEDEDYQTKVHIIPQAPAVTEEEAYALDVAQRPDTPDLEAYQRVPIEDFGAALLRGMGGGNKKVRPKVEAYVPKQRTALLGIGAKSREETFGKDWVAQQDGVKKGSNKREQMKFMPLQRVDRPSSSGTASPAPLPIEAGRPESSTSRRRRHEDYSDSESREKRRRKSRKSYDDKDDSDQDARSRRKRRDRSRSPREGDRDRRDRDRSKRDDREYDSKRSRDEKDRSRDSSRRERQGDRDDRKDSRRDSRDDDGDRYKERREDRGDSDRNYRDEDRDRRRH